MRLKHNNKYASKQHYLVCIFMDTRALEWRSIDQ